MVADQLPRFTLFADESGIAPPTPCYSIGALTLPEGDLDWFESEFDRLRQMHGVVGEVRWKKVSTSHGLMNCALDLLRLVIQSAACFSSITVKKETYLKWQSGELDDAFYTTYSLLLKHCAKRVPGVYTAFIDARSETYPKHHEALQVITSHMLARIPKAAKLTAVTKSDSKRFAGIQTADMFTGAINAAHSLYLNSDIQISDGKRLLLARFAALLGWDALHYDTYPNHAFNIWHFPPEGYRAVPATLDVSPRLDVEYVTADDLKGEVVHGG
jgi:hypothetical protein